MSSLYKDLQLSKSKLAEVTDESSMRATMLLSLGGVVAAGLDVAGILLLIPLIDRLSSPSTDGQSSITWILVGIVGFLVGKTALMAAIHWWSAGLVQKMGANTATRLFSSYMNAPLEFHDSRNSADLLRSNSRAIDELFYRGVMGLAGLIAEGGTILTLSILLLFVSPIPAVAGILYFSLVSIAFLRIVQPYNRRFAVEGQERTATTIQLLQEGLAGWREYVVRGATDGLVSRFSVERHGLARATRATLFISQVSRYYLEAAFVIAFGVIAAVTVNTSEPDESLATLAVLLAVGFRVLPAISRLLSAFAAVKVGTVALDIVHEEIVASAANGSPASPVRSVEFHDRPQGANSSGLLIAGVSFSYKDSVPALKDISVSVPRGSSLGIVGPSGAGKSTLLDILCGLRVPSSGSLSVDGLPLTADTMANWRLSVGFVPQHVFLLDGSVANNVAFGLAVDEDKVWDALSSAQIDEFVRGLPDGIETRIGERGTLLSGGQRQRLGIARALYDGPSFLVLDEATAALDGETEAAVVTSLAALDGEMTTIVVAHRLSTIRDCSQIAYLEDGHLRALGSFEEVIATVDRFANSARLAGMIEDAR